MSEQDMVNKEIGAIILAAGYSSRMGDFKAGMEIGGKAVIGRLIASFHSVGIKDIVVVSGYNREKLKSLIKEENVTETHNERYPEGMFTSIQKGTEAISDKKKGFFIIPVDCPILEKETLRELIKKANKEEDAFIVPCYRGKKGHPLYVPIVYRDKILKHNGENGLKGITDRLDAKMTRIELKRESVVMDMDTPEDYERLTEFVENGMKDQQEHIKELAQGRTFYLIRHGKIRQHKEKIFLGQTDVPLSNEGREQAINAKKLLPENIDKVYSSDLKRAVETAERICPNVIKLKGFREMNLGDWDGKYISEIEREFPEEYRKRGENIFSFKKGNKSENFFDLQYRVNGELINILKKDKSSEIYIVAHSGVLRCIENNLKGGSVEDSWQKLGNGQVRIVSRS